MAVNSDVTLLAITCKEDIHIYETEKFTRVGTLRGHTSAVGNVAFQLGNPKVLVSGSSETRGLLNEEPKILIWDLDEQAKHPMLDEDTIAKIAGKATETAIKDMQEADPQLSLSDADEKMLTSALEPAISHIVKTQSVANRSSLVGRLSQSFQSEIFSHSGAHLIYMPGKRPYSNSNDVWDIKIYSMSTHEDAFTLRGHTDALMWTGYSPEDTMIATVAWDQSMRIWDATSGQQKYKFETKGQNWTGGFSPDSQLFAGTCGDGSLYVYSLKDGSTLVHHQPKNSNWLRALDWSADSKILAVGGGQRSDSGGLFLFDVEKKEVTQHRLLSTEKCKVADELRSMMSGYLECHAVKFVDRGRKVVALTSGDGGFETYDLEDWVKWRFARPGVDPPFGDGSEGEETKKEGDDVAEPAHGGYRMEVWDDEKRGTAWIASMDSDGVRIWDVPMTRDSDS